MSTPSQPALFIKPFADEGAKNTIPNADASPLASFTKGFPAVTMIPIESGGVPPAGEDFNGILFEMSNHLFFLGAGGRYRFSSVLASAIGGYPSGFVVQGDDGISEYVSLIDGNTYDPNTPSNIGTRWAPYGGAAGFDGHYALDTGATNALEVALVPPAVANTKGRVVYFRASHTNTGATTLDIGGGATAIMRNDDTALSANDIIAGGVYAAVYDAASGHFRLTAPTASQYAPTATTSVGGYKNLSAGADGIAATIPITLDLVTVRSVIDGTNIGLTNVNVTLDTASIGVGGLDTGTLDVSTWYYAYIIHNPGTNDTQALCSLDPLSPTLPAGYTHIFRCLAFITDATGDKFPRAGVWADDTFQYRITPGSNVTAWPQIAIGNTANYDTFQAASTSTVVPPTANAIDVHAMADQGAGATTVAVSAVDTASRFDCLFRAVGSATSHDMRCGRVVLVTSNIYYAATGSANNKVRCIGFRDAI
jgi:hypothetical protein